MKFNSLAADEQTEKNGELRRIIITNHISVFVHMTHDDDCYWY